MAKPLPVAVTWRVCAASRPNGTPLCQDIWTSLLSLHPDHLPPDSQSGGGVQKPVVAQRLLDTPMANPMADNDFPWLLLLRWSGVCLHRQPARSTRPLLPDGCSCEVSQVARCPPSRHGHASKPQHSQRLFSLSLWITSNTNTFSFMWEEGPQPLPHAPTPH